MQLKNTKQKVSLSVKELKKKRAAKSIVFIFCLFLVTGTLFQNCSLNKLTSANSMGSSPVGGNGGLVTPPVTSTSCQFDNVTVQSGVAVLAYQSSSVESGSVCQSESRTCVDGKISGSYQHSSCVVNALVGDVCPSAGQITCLSDAGTSTYNTESELRNSVLCSTAGANKVLLNNVALCGGPWDVVARCTSSSSCQTPVKSSCPFNNTSLAHGMSVLAYQSQSVPAGQVCQSQSRTCNDGTLSGSYNYASCTVEQQPPPPPPALAGSIDLNKPFSCTESYIQSVMNSPVLTKNTKYIPFTYANYRELLYSFDTAAIAAINGPSSNYNSIGKMYINDQLIPGTGQKNQITNRFICTQASVYLTGSKGCVDDNNVPIIHVFNSAVMNGSSSVGEFGHPGGFKIPLSTTPDPSKSIYSTVAIKLIIGPQGAYYRRGVMQMGFGSATGVGSVESVISRCRGQFGAGGREQIVSNKDFGWLQATPFPMWEVDYNQPLSSQSAMLRSTGVRAPDGYISEGVYYLNVKAIFGEAFYINTLIGGGVPAAAYDNGSNPNDQFRAYEINP